MRGGTEIVGCAGSGRGAEEAAGAGEAGAAENLKGGRFPLTWAWPFPFEEPPLVEPLTGGLAGGVNGAAGAAGVTWR